MFHYLPNLPLPEDDRYVDTPENYPLTAHKHQRDLDDKPNTRNNREWFGIYRVNLVGVHFIAK